MSKKNRQLTQDERDALAAAVRRYMEQEKLSTHVLGRRADLSAQAVTNARNGDAGYLTAQALVGVIGKSLAELVAEHQKGAQPVPAPAPERTVEYEARYYEAEEAFKDALAAGEDPKVVEAARHRLARFKDHMPTRAEAFELIKQARAGREEARRALGPSEVFEEKPTIPRRGK